MLLVVSLKDVDKMELPEVPGQVWGSSGLLTLLVWTPTGSRLGQTLASKWFHPQKPENTSRLPMMIGLSSIKRGSFGSLIKGSVTWRPGT